MNAELVRLKKLSLQADELTSSGKIEASRIKIIDGLELALAVEARYFFYFFNGELNYLDEHLLAATEYYRQAYELETKNLLMLRGLGVVYSKRNLFKKAIALFNRGIQLHSYDFRLWRQTGVTYSKMKEIDKALNCFDQALKLEPNDYHSFRQRGVTLAKVGRDQEALQMFAHALTLNANDFRSHYEKSKTLESMGNGSEATRVRSLSIEIENKVTRVPARESLLARIKMNRVRKNQEQILERFYGSLSDESVTAFKK